jgi:hypothetical protein
LVELRRKLSVPVCLDDVGVEGEWVDSKKKAIAWLAEIEADRAAGADLRTSRHASVA